ncbi:uncharacterized protein BP01DRAFT_385542 [Aspergillus saccharolyticus JOP 1030-1]|uniref:O-methyltransferase dimerisation domain-containing protein n=1 Tax=Aspergillus saccharolyticus JOP 1030-1 TaxID=1450539 RepID=A0A318ZFP1_9EURO|nr:hypothetical protein BP01DRAFT_385542 [Aspergillus saccharolyticus JOP 1030-1]PYH42440.1 hypothetical protein BP01DRAFT_385542 [Aspergillus saccharolyticus JOP 1030-1]
MVRRGSSSLKDYIYILRCGRSKNAPKRFRIFSRPGFPLCASRLVATVEANEHSDPAVGSHVVHNADLDRIAVSPVTPEKVASLAQKIDLLSKAFTSNQTAARLQLLNVADSLQASFETPCETIFRYCWRNTTSFAVIEPAIDLGIFRHLSQNDRPLSVAELATATGAEIVLLQRIMNSTLCTPSQKPARTNTFATIFRGRLPALATVMRFL